MRGAKPERALEAIVDEELALDAGATIVVACSGGPDSVALADLAATAAARREAHVVLGHVNHGRRASADQDEAVVLSVAARLGLRLRVARPAIGRDDEAALRRARYAALAEIAASAGAGAVVTAHAAEDQSETVLLALFRGAGLEGLAGIPVRRQLAEGIALVRPLLRVPRSRLAEHLRRAALPYALDPTNRDRRYRRNALRAALEALRRDFPHLDAAIARCSAIVAGELAGHDRARTRRRVRTSLRDAGDLADVPFERIEAAARALERGSRGRLFLKPGVEWTLDEHAEPRIVRRRD